MDNNKSCFLILSYTDTIGKEFSLIRLVKKLKDMGHKIVLSSHMIPSSFVLDNIDHFIYDSDNDLRPMYPVKRNLFNPRVFLEIYTKYFGVKSKFTHKIYHGLAVGSVMYNGLMTSKMLGFEKCHLLEYDSDLDGDSEFMENDRLLEQYDSIHYHTGISNDFAYIAIGSYNLSSYSFEELSWDLNKNKIETLLSSYSDNIGDGMIELAIYKTLHKPKNTLRKYEKNLSNGNIKLDLSNNTKFDKINDLDILFFMIEDSVNVIIVFKRKDKESNENLQFIVNDSIIHSKNFTYEGEWAYFSLCEFKDLKTIDVFNNSRLLKRYDFINEIDKNELKNYSWVFPR